MARHVSASAVSTVSPQLPTRGGAHRGRAGRHSRLRSVAAASVRSEPRHRHRGSRRRTLGGMVATKRRRRPRHPVRPMPPRASRQSDISPDRPVASRSLRGLWKDKRRNTTWPRSWLASEGPSAFVTKVGTPLVAVPLLRDRPRRSARHRALVSKPRCGVASVSKVRFLLHLVFADTLTRSTGAGARLRGRDGAGSRGVALPLLRTPEPMRGFSSRPRGQDSARRARIGPYG